MYGAPKDVEGKCNARLELGDDYGDNSCTFLCELNPDHQGRHKESCSRFTMEWEGNDAELFSPGDDWEENPS